MESQPQNLEFRINPENFHPCYCHLLSIDYSAYIQMYFGDYVGSSLIRVHSVCFHEKKSDLS